MVIAHRGYKREFPENTLSAFDAAFSAGADAIECDIRLAKDDVAVVSHDSVKDSNNVLGLCELFDYIKSKSAPFFLELKSGSPVLLERAIKLVSQNNLWDRVHLIGFSTRIRTALRAQDYYPKLLVGQILMVPFLHYIKPPRKGSAIYFGWLDFVRFSEPLFRSLVSRDKVCRLREMYESLGFRVYAGVLNREDGIRYFQDAGICDIFTDEVELAVCLKQT